MLTVGQDTRAFAEGIEATAALALATRDCRSDVDRDRERIAREYEKRRQEARQK